MGVHSTLTISRRSALRSFRTLSGTDPDNEVLEALLNSVLDRRGYNVAIIANEDACGDGDLEEFVMDEVHR